MLGFRAYALFEEWHCCNSFLNVLDCWLSFNWYLNWVTNFSKSFCNLSQLTSEGVGTNDGPFFSNGFCCIVKDTADKLIAFWSGKLFFMLMILYLQLCLYLFMFSVFFCLIFHLENSPFFYVIVSELYSYLILSLINLRFFFLLIDLSNDFNLFLMVAKNLL